MRGKSGLVEMQVLYGPSPASGVSSNAPGSGDLAPDRLDAHPGVAAPLGRYDAGEATCKS